MNITDLSHIYVCHYTPLANRKPILMQRLKEYNLSATWIEAFDREQIDLEEVKSIIPKVCEPFSLDGHNRTLRLAEVSVMLKHYFAWCHASLFYYSPVLFLEDDVRFTPNFDVLFNEYLKDLPCDWDIVWLGSCCNLHAPTPNGEHVVQVPRSRCCHGYLMRSQSIKLAIENIKTNNWPVDCYFNKLIPDFDLKSYWVEPDLIVQDAEFETAIQKETVFV